jgi:hypothetical protein
MELRVGTKYAPATLVRSEELHNGTPLRPWDSVEYIPEKDPRTVLLVE